MRFADEGEVLDFAQKLNLEAQGIAAGLTYPEDGKAISVEFHGDVIYADCIVSLFPPYMNWQCTVCEGRDDRCRWCDGTGWRVNDEPDKNGLFVRRVNVGPRNAIFMLLERHVWEEME